MRHAAGVTGAAAAGPAIAWAGGRTRSRAWIGRQTSRCSSANACRVWRHPMCSTPHCASGMQIVLANPAISVSPMIGRW